MSIRNNPLAKRKVLEYRSMYLILDKHDKNGEPVPFRIKYLCKDGSIMKENNVVCTKRDKKKGTSNIMLLDTKDSSEYAKQHGIKKVQVRTIRDILILELNDYHIIVT